MKTPGKRRKIDGEEEGRRVLVPQRGCFPGGREGGPHGPNAGGPAVGGSGTGRGAEGSSRRDGRAGATLPKHTGAARRCPAAAGAARGLESLGRLEDAAAAVVVRGLRRLREGSGRRQVRRAAGGRRVPRVTAQEGGGGAGAGGARAAPGPWMRSEVPGGRRGGGRRR